MDPDRCAVGVLRRLGARRDTVISSTRPALSPCPNRPGARSRGIAGVAPASPAGPAAVLAHAGLAGHRSGSGHRRRGGCRISGSAGLRSGQRHEALASVIVIWRFTGTRLTGATAERRAQQLVAVSFFLLGPYIAAEAGWGLCTGIARKPASPAWRSPLEPRSSNLASVSPSGASAPVSSCRHRRGRHPEPAVRVPGHRGIRRAARPIRRSAPGGWTERSRT